MAAAESVEPPIKKKTIDFSLCLKCQGNNNLVTQPTLSAYEKFLVFVRERSDYGNPEYVTLSQQFYGLSPEDLEQNHATWHRSCYAKVTHKQHTERDKARWMKALDVKNSKILSTRAAGRPSSSTTGTQNISTAPSGRVTRSHVQAFKRDCCFYCQDVKYDSRCKEEELHECRSQNIGKSIEEVVLASENEVLKVRLADVIAEGDFLSRDVKYHKSCHTSNWRCYVQGPKRLGEKKNLDELNTVEFISAEIEYFAEIEERLKDGEFLTTKEVTALYSTH